MTTTAEGDWGYCSHQGCTALIPFDLEPPLCSKHELEPERSFAQEMGCICPHGERSLGTLYGVHMGKGMVRLSTTKDCPLHDQCQRFTKADRAGRPSWSDPWCVIHGKKDCPEEGL